MVKYSGEFCHKNVLCCVIVWICNIIWFASKYGEKNVVISRERSQFVCSRMGFICKLTKNMKIPPLHITLYVYVSKHCNQPSFKLNYQFNLKNTSKKVLYIFLQLKLWKTNKIILTFYLTNGLKGTDWWEIKFCWIYTLRGYSMRL